MTIKTLLAFIFVKTIDLHISMGQFIQKLTRKDSVGSIFQSPLLVSFENEMHVLQHIQISCSALAA